MKLLIRMLIVAFIVFTLSACGGRDTSSVETAIIGHWISESQDSKFEDTHYYIDEKQITMLNGESEKTVFDYVVTRSSEKESWIQIKLTSPSGGGHEKELKFENDERTNIFSTYDIDSVDSTTEYQSGEETKEVMEVIKSLVGNMEFEENWKYVDGSTEPK